MTKEQHEIIKNLFSRCGYPSETGEITIREYLLDPSRIDELDKVKRYDKSASDAIKRMEKAIETLTIYRIALCERYNFISTAPKEQIIKLKREKRDSVTYYLMKIEKNLEDGHEVIVENKRYSGKERSQAFADYNSYINTHPHVTAIQETEKGRWER